MPQLSREQVCGSTAAKLKAAAGSLSGVKALIGLDGFVEQQAAGHGPTMAMALASAGLSVTYIGNLGHPTVHPAFAELARRATVISTTDPSEANAPQAEAGKPPLNPNQPLKEVTWDNLLSRVGPERIKQLLASARLIGMVNWTMLPHMSRMWAKLLDEVIPNTERHQRKLFVDLADPRWRTNEDVMDALRLLTRFQDQVDVILGLNLKESMEIADVLGLPGKVDPEPYIEETARAIRAELNLACVVIHPRRGAAAAIASGESATFAGPFVHQPKISTGAGDHFNAGFCLGRVLGFGLEESLCTGVASSGYYVRTAQSPSAADLADFIAELPPPQA